MNVTKSNKIMMWLTIGLLAFGGFEMWHVHHLKTEQTQVAAQLASEQDSLKTLTQNNEKIRYVVDNNGAANPASQPTVNLITQKIAPLLCTWVSEGDYNNNRQQMTQYVNDKNFFEGKTAIMGGQMDITNHSYIQAQHLKSELSQANCYMMPDGSYLAVMKFYLYTKNSTMTETKALKPSYIAFTCRSDGHTINNVQLVPGMSLTRADDGN